MQTKFCKHDLHEKHLVNTKVRIVHTMFIQCSYLHACMYIVSVCINCVCIFQIHLQMLLIYSCRPTGCRPELHAGRAVCCGPPAGCGPCVAGRPAGRRNRRLAWVTLVSLIFPIEADFAISPSLTEIKDYVTLHFRTNDRSKSASLASDIDIFEAPLKKLRQREISNFNDDIIYSLS